MKVSWKKGLVAAGISGSLLFGGIIAYAATDSPAQSDGQRPAFTRGFHKGFHQGNSEFKRGGFHNGFSEVAKLLGMDADALKMELNNGKSLAEIAQSKGVSKEDLTAKLLAIAQVRTDEAVKSGKLTAEKAVSIKENMKAKITAAIDKKHDGSRKGRDGFKGLPVQKYFSQAAALVGLQPQELKSELKSGKSLVEIAQAKGIPQEQLKAQVLETAQKEIASLVEQGKLTQEKADLIKKQMEQRIDNMLTHKGFHQKDLRGAKKPA